MNHQKSHKWRPTEDAKLCSECERAFKPGDKVFTDVAVNIHEACLENYGKTLKKLGMKLGERRVGK